MTFSIFSKQQSVCEITIGTVAILEEDENIVLRKSSHLIILQVDICVEIITRKLIDCRQTL